MEPSKIETLNSVVESLAGEDDSLAASGSASQERAAASLKETAQARAVHAFSSAMERGSWGTCRRTGARLGLLFYYGVRKRREIAVANVRLAFPDIGETRANQIARRSMQNFGMTFCEFLRLRTASAREVREHVDIDGLEYVEAAFAQGRGALLLTGHFGNWELMGARLVQEFPVTAMSRPSSNTVVQNHLAAIREALGINVISKFDTARAALKVLRAKRALAIFVDHWGGYHEPLLPMFGHPTRCVTAVARLSLMARAPIIAGFGIRRTPWLADGRIIARGFPAFEVADAGIRDAGAREAAVLEGTLRGIQHIEAMVRQYPDQWLWLHRRWRPEDMAASRE